MFEADQAKMLSGELDDRVHHGRDAQRLEIGLDIAGGPWVGQRVVGGDVAGLPEDLELVPVLVLAQDLAGGMSGGCGLERIDATQGRPGLVEQPYVDAFAPDRSGGALRDLARQPVDVAGEQLLLVAELFDDLDLERGPTHRFQQGALGGLQLLELAGERLRAAKRRRGGARCATVLPVEGHALHSGRAGRRAPIRCRATSASATASGRVTVLPGRSSVIRNHPGSAWRP